MATPVTTTSDPSAYAQYKKQLNEILYSKGQYVQGQQQSQQSGGKQGQGLMNWAANNAQQYYSQLPTDLANQVRGMSLDQMQQFYNSLSQPAQPPTPPQPTPLDVYNQGMASNPYDQQVADLIGRLTSAVNTPQVNPFDAQIQALLGQLTTAMNTPIADPTSTPQYTAAKARLDRQQADEINTAAEVLGGSGFARSTLVTDRAQDISQQFADYMETQIIPGIVQQLQADKQANISNLGQLLEATSGQQGVFDQRQTQELNNLATLYDALVGQQGAFNSKIQQQFSNTIAQQGADLQQSQFEHQQRIDNATLELQNIEAALQRTTTLGSVSAQDAELLGVPAGTPSFQAANAVAQRKHELEVQKRDAEAAMARTQAQIAASWKETQARIGAEKERAREAREEAAKAEDYRLLISLWNQTGTAPKGLERFGIAEGTPVAQSPMSPQDMLAQIELDQAKADQQQQQYIDTNAPAVQTRYGVNKVTAEAILSVLDNPNANAAMAEIASTEAQLVQMGVDTRKLQQAVKDFYPTKGSTKDAEREYKSSGANKKYPKDDWMKWYNDNRGRLSNVDFETWRSQYGSNPTITSRSK